MTIDVIGNQVKIVDGKSSLEEMAAVKRIENGHQITIGTTKDGITIEKASRDCRKFGTAFPEPSIHKL
ncbi:hypothetical protein ACNSOL_11815 (plasmid) [Aliarcobacter lanthieri]|uniref:hypothetical protein n=1 Tax=Aliarcobacter lanthieri TaxID=1355374 RepID=UPI003AB06F3B